VALLVGELRSRCGLQDIVSPHSSLSYEGIENVLEGFNEATIRVVLRLTADDVMHRAH
jgi:hypothetical protein